MSPAKPLLLVLDDQPEILSLLQKLLSLQGYEVRTAGDGEALVAECQAAMDAGLSPSAALLDLSLPVGPSGEETAARLQSLVAGLPCIAVSGGSFAHPFPFPSPLFVDFIAKPFALDAVLETVARVLAEAGTGTLAES